MCVAQLSQVSGVNFDSLELSTCGEDKGCFLYPRYCSGPDCVAAVSYRQEGDHFRFELTAKDATYVSVGFSDDARMVSFFCFSAFLYSILEGFSVCDRF